MDTDRAQYALMAKRTPMQSRTGPLEPEDTRNLVVWVPQEFVETGMAKLERGAIRVYLYLDRKSVV